MKIDIFIGIDQTGALIKPNKLKPLTLSIIDTHLNQIYKGTIANLNESELIVIFNKNNINYLNKKILICVDCAIGMPSQCKTPLKDLLSDIKNYSHLGQSYGAQTAHHFFNSYSSNSQPFKNSELLVGAHNLFKLLPYQKNISCGSYRILKNLSTFFSVNSENQHNSQNSKKNNSQLVFWPFDFKNLKTRKKQTTYIICEGYPSLYYKVFLNIKNRNLNQLSTYIKQNYNLNVSFKNLDEADAFMLAYAGFRFHKTFLSNKTINKFSFSILNYEGWILGLNFI